MYIRSNRIDNQKFKNWVLNWDEYKYLNFFKERFNSNSSDIEEIAQIRLNTVRQVKEFVNSYEQIDDLYENTTYVLNPALYECYFLNENDILNVANYFEILLLPADIHTKKSLISGFEKEIKKFGNIDIKWNNDTIGSIGSLSDLGFQMYSNKFIQEETTIIESDDETYYFDENVYINDNENYVSLKIWHKPEDVDLDFLIEHIIYSCAINHSLFFKRPHFEKQMFEKGNASEFEISLNCKEYDKIPLLYFNSAKQNSSERMIFLSYYQVIEYYFQKANNKYLQDKLVNAKITTNQEFDINLVNKIIKSYSNNGKSEKYAIKLVIRDAINYQAFIDWLDKSSERKNYFTKGNSDYTNLLPIDITDIEKCASTIANRIYSVRCSIVHSKGDTNDFAFIPNMNDTVIQFEIPFILFISSCVLEAWT